MAKGQVRGSKETKKPKNKEKGAKHTPKYMETSELGSLGSSGSPLKLGQKK
ncbi:hypothetical protein [Afifella marina]|uniref:Uncharacterized protein n=1 Tax=Afifella marina DSM 2698 TaxID=1120955 RepID=A0A1G5M3Y9_AFIMA|nr:hypothetical protein [Afifella marina]SCZ19491.1 hypothetical protein SAMN03080610_00021 [Afifella marina DSM 2698]